MIELHQLCYLGKLLYMHGFDLRNHNRTSQFWMHDVLVKNGSRLDVQSVIRWLLKVLIRLVFLIPHLPVVFNVSRLVNQAQPLKFGNVGLRHFRNVNNCD